MACQELRAGPNNNLPCNKRVDERGFCATCDRSGKTTVKVTIRCRFADYEDQTWLTSFHEASTKILGMSGDQVKALDQAANERGESGREELEAALRKHYFEKPMNLTIRAKLDSYNGEARSNVTVIDANPVSYSERGRQMLKEIHEIVSTTGLA